MLEGNNEKGKEWSLWNRGKQRTKKNPAKNSREMDETGMTQEERTSICYNIKSHLYDGYEKEFFDECIKNLSNRDSRLRLSNFAYALRELVREVLADRAPDERIKKCVWYKPEYNEKGQEIISRTQRMKYAIHGGLPDSIVKDEMEILIEDTTKEVKKQIDRLSKYTHITKDVFYTKDDIETLAQEPLKAVESLLVSIEDAKERFNELMFGTIDNEIFNIFLYRTIDEIDSLATHHNIDVYNLGETKVVDINDECIYFHASGTVIVHLQFGANADFRNDIGGCPLLLKIIQMSGRSTFYMAARSTTLA